MNEFRVILLVLVGPNDSKKEIGFDRILHAGREEKSCGKCNVIPSNISTFSTSTVNLYCSIYVIVIVYSASSVRLEYCLLDVSS